jgi:hypothetical protein
MAALYGCASNFSNPGAMVGLPLEQVRSRLGDPTYEVKLDNGGTRRFYTDYVSMVHSWRADFDAKGRLIEVAPATTSSEFAEAQPGTWHKADILEHFGLPYKTESYNESGVVVLTYLFREYGIRDAYMVLTCDAKDLLTKVEVMPVDPPLDGKFPKRRIVPSSQEISN